MNTRSLHYHNHQQQAHQQLGAPPDQQQQQQWELRISVDADPPSEVSVRVSGETHVGSVLCQLVDKLAAAAGVAGQRHRATDWSDHALWWPSARRWLARTKLTLDQCGVQADARLLFTRTHKPLRVQLPDLQVVELARVDFATPVFHAVKQVCKQLAIRHSEELSFLKPLTTATPTAALVAHRATTDNDCGDSASSNSTLNNSSSGSSHSPSTVKAKNGGGGSGSVKNGHQDRFVRELSNSLSVDSHQTIDLSELSTCVDSGVDLQSLAFSPVMNTHDTLSKTGTSQKLKSIFDKTRVNTR